MAVGWKQKKILRNFDLGKTNKQHQQREDMLKQKECGSDTDDYSVVAKAIKGAEKKKSVFSSHCR